MSYDITSRYDSTKVVYHSDTATTVREAVSEALARGADLSDANLSDAYLSDADLRGANLSDAYLRGANLSDAYLSDADLRGANLSDAYLSDADLRGANLRDADLSDADLSGANLSGANLRDADLSGANLRDAKHAWHIPIIADIHRRMLSAVTAEGCKLDMHTWHTCETTHCRAGWAVTLAGEAGKVLESIYGTGTAAALIYQASDPTMERVPDWYASDDEAMQDMERLAAVGSDGNKP